MLLLVFAGLGLSCTGGSVNPDGGASDVTATGDSPAVDSLSDSLSDGLSDAGNDPGLGGTDAEPRVDVFSRWGDCSRESGLVGRDDIIMCEGWEAADWWSDGYVSNARVSDDPVATTAERMDNVTIETDSSKCISGSCLRMAVNQYRTRHLAEHWLMKNAARPGEDFAPDHVFIRYYMKLGAEWTPEICTEDGTVDGSGGKFPGLADVRVNHSATGEEQCGNGGAAADGINCWSMRTGWRACGGGSYSTQVCDTVPGGVARFMSYLYYRGQEGATGNAGPWDDDPWGAFGGRETPCGAPNNMFCGDVTPEVDNAGVLVPGRWMAIEMEVQMNTPGMPDGVIRGWIDDRLAFEKTNMIFRDPGHDNLHVRSIWLNVFHGGTRGACQASNVWLDQLVASTSRIGTLSR